MKEYIKKLNKILTKQDKLRLILLLLFSFVVALVETAGISVIMPFVSVATDFSIIHTSLYLSTVYEYFNFKDELTFVMIFGVTLLVFYVIRGFLNSTYIYAVSKFSFSKYSDIMNALFFNYLHISYKQFSDKNPSVFTKSLVNETAYLVDLIKAVLFLLSELIVLILIYSILLYVNYQITFFITLFVFLVAIIFIRPINRIIKLKGKERESNQNTFYEIINKSFRNLKMLKLQNKSNSIKEFEEISFSFANSVRVAATIQHFPRFIFETMAFSILVVIILYLVYINQSNISEHYDVITIFILGLYRLLPSITRIIQYFNTIIFNHKSLDIIYKDYNLVLEENKNDKIPFTKNIVFKNVSFSYNNKINAIDNLNLRINKYDKIGFMGQSGGGKSTLVDIIMGLHSIKEGSICVDGKELTAENMKTWRNYFGYIPQNVYLFDDTIANNVAFGLKKNEKKLIEVLKQANIWEFLDEKEGLDTNVGESGVMLSGGQKQRIAIARALYKEPEILVLDEATSALDNDTELKIMNEIYKIAENKTLIIIAHRLSTIQTCNKIFELDNGKIIYKSEK